MSSVKFSNFDPTITPLRIGDILVGLRNGKNEQFINNGCDGAITYEVIQNAHGFTINDVIRLSGDSYVQAQADTEIDSLAIGIVTAIINANVFHVTTAGKINFTRFVLVPGDVYYLDPDVAGNVTNIAPTDPSDIIKSILIADTTHTAILSSDISSAHIINVSNLELIGNNLEATNANGDVNLVPNGTGTVTSSTSFDVLNDSSVRWWNSTNSNYFAFKANPTLATDLTFTLPITDGLSGDVMSTDGAGNLSFITPTHGTVTEIDTGTGLTGGPITDNGTISLIVPVTEILGGTNQTTYDQGDILYASASNTLSRLPKDINATRYLSNTGTDNSPIWDQIDLTEGVTGILPVANGGTGANTLTAHGILLGQGTSAITSQTLTDGQLLIGSTGSDPVAAQLTAGASVDIINTPGGIEINVVGVPGTVFWSDVSGTSHTLDNGLGYVATNAALTTFTLPSTAGVGDMFGVADYGVGSGGWTVEQNAGQTITTLGVSTTTGVSGSLSSAQAGVNAIIVCVVANTGFEVMSFSGSMTIV